MPRKRRILSLNADFTADADDDHGKQQAADRRRSPETAAPTESRTKRRVACGPLSVEKGLRSRSDLRQVASGKPGRPPGHAALVAMCALRLHRSIRVRLALRLSVLWKSAVRSQLSAAANSRGTVGADLAKTPSFRAERRLHADAAEGHSAGFGRTPEGTYVIAGHDEAGATITPQVRRIDAWGHLDCGSAGGCATKAGDARDDGKACTLDRCDGSKGCASTPASGCTEP